MQKVKGNLKAKCLNAAFILLNCCKLTNYYYDSFILINE